MAFVSFARGLKLHSLLAFETVAPFGVFAPVGVL